MKFAAIFDMDGVLVDTFNLVWKSQNKVLKKYGINITKDEAYKKFGRPVEYDIKELNEKYNLSLELIPYTRSFCASQRRTLKEKGPNKNLVHLLDNLKDNQVPLAIGTSSGRDRANWFLKNLKLKPYFSVIVAQEDVNNHKPSPDVFLKAAELLGYVPENCVVFEDSYLGVLAGKIARMRVIGYLGENNSLRNLRDADLVISNFSDIDYEKIKKMFSKDFILNNNFLSPNTRGEKLF